MTFGSKYHFIYFTKGASISAHLLRCESFAAGKTTAATFDVLHMHQT
jgi:hypothetical protein